MKNILFMMPSYYNFDEVVLNGLKMYSGCEINSIDTVGNGVYKNFGDRIVNFLSKVFLGKNLKPEMKKKSFINAIDKFEEYEYLIVNRPDIISATVLEKALSKSKKTILLLWDSLEKIPIAENIIALFDKIYSFDPEDCDKYNFSKIENFHFGDACVANLPSQFDVVFLGTLDSRIDDLNSIFNNLKMENKTSKAYIYVPPKLKLKHHHKIEILTKITPFKNSFKFSLSGKVILDLAHKNQRGLSFRVFEAMALRKKLITTNRHVVNYDFYNQDNILIVKDAENFKAPDSFWETDYQELPLEIVQKYYIKNWVRRILNDS